MKVLLLAMPDAISALDGLVTIPRASTDREPGLPLRGVECEPCAASRLPMSSLFSGFHNGVENREHDQRKQHGRDESTQDNRCQRPLNLRATSGRKEEGGEPQQRG